MKTKNVKKFVWAFSALAFMLLLVAVWATRPHAQANWPDQPIHVVVPYPPAGGTDILSRYVLDRIQKKIGQPIVIENRGGATGVIGTREVARARPDGYTLLMGHIAPQAINPGDFLSPREARDWHTLDPVALVATAPSLLLVRADVPARDPRALVTWLRTQPNPAYGSDGVGSLAHLQMESLMNGVSVTHVPYKGGGPALQGLMSGDVPVIFSPAPVALAHVHSGKVVAIAQTGRLRLAELPLVPTMRELGIPDLEAPLWWGLFAPGYTPAIIKLRLARAVRETLSDPATRTWLAQNGYQPAPDNTPEDFADYVAAERKRWSRVVENSMFILPSPAK